MTSKLLTRGAALACGVLLLAGLPAVADDKPALSGTWVKKDRELRIEFADKGALTIAPHGDPAEIAITCDYTVTKDGVVKAKITGFEGKEELKKKIAERVPVGLQFSFKWAVKGEAARLDDLTGDNVDILKSHMEGDFEQQK